MRKNGVTAERKRKKEKGKMKRGGKRIERERRLRIKTGGIRKEKRKKKSMKFQT